MISNLTYDIITNIAKEHVPNKVHSQLHVNSKDAWIELIADLVEKGSVKPKMSVLMKCALGWETLLTTKFSRLN